VDEIFANQVFSSSFNASPTPFVSILSLDVLKLVGCDHARIHVLAGPTKDFGGSGFKLGALISQNNKQIIDLVSAAMVRTPVSGATDAFFTPLLRDTEYVDWYLKENRLRLRSAFELVGNWCQFHNIP
jgi:1-aminocyclopropane-1-carboxylate synthase